MRACRGLFVGIATLAGFFIADAALGYGDRTETVVLNNNTGRYVNWEVISDDGSNHVWPGGGDAFRLLPHSSSQESLNCNQGQRMCYGAWVRGDENLYWGVGNNHEHHCDACCFTCNGEAETFNLKD
jgi:hypothetical protein